MKWEVRKRLEEIDRCLYWLGRVQRSNLINTFGISPQQASADFALYQQLAPDNAQFNTSLKHYEPADNYEPAFFKADIQDYFQWAQCWSPVTAAVPSPLRTMSSSVLKAVVNAIHNTYSIEITYQSMSSPKPGTRQFTPHSIVYDGYRYHVRGFCHKREDFRDFVLGRISQVASRAAAGRLKHEDEAWNTNLILRLVPHPELTPAQRQVIERDFGMEDGELRLKVREALLVYTLVQLRLDRFSELRSPAEQQIVLVNPEILDCAG